MKKYKEKLIMLIGGALVGFAGGFFGGGGGMLCVPLLNKLLKVDTKQSHATAMLVILPMSIASAITYFFNGHYQLNKTVIVGIGVFAGGLIGAFLLKKLNSFVVSLIFSLLMIAAGIRLIVG